MAHIGLTERFLVLVVVARLAAAEGLVLRLVVGPILELLRRILLELLHLRLGALVLLLGLLRLGVRVVLVSRAGVLFLCGRLLAHVSPDTRRTRSITRLAGSGNALRGRLRGPGRPVDGRCTDRGLRETDISVADGLVRDLWLRVGTRRAQGARVQGAVAVRRGPGDRRPDPDPVPRRPRSRDGDAAAGMAAAAAEAGPGDADHLHPGGVHHQARDQSELDRGIPARRAAVANRPGAVVERGHEPARAAHRAALPQPRVGPQRRTGTAGRARVRVCARSVE